MQPQVQTPRGESSRAQRARARHARHRVYHWLRITAASLVFVASLGAMVGVLVLHLGIRPVLTASMRPDYGPGAVLLTRRVPVTSIRPGMIVLIVPPGKSVVYAHRIVSVTGPRNAPVVTTKGDANKAADPWHAKITAKNVDEVIGSAPVIGRLLVGVRGPGQILLALLGALVAAWAAVRWALSSSPRPSTRRATAGGT